MAYISHGTHVSYHQAHTREPGDVAPHIGKPRSRHCDWHWIAFFWVLFVMAILQAAALWIKTQDLQDYSDESYSTNGAVPNGHWSKVTFDSHPAFYHLPTAKHARAAWKMYNLPGLVRADSLPANVPINVDSTDGKEMRLAISVIHQLHCMEAIQKLTIRLVTGEKLSVSDDAHTNHCFDYWRHSIMCAGDMTLESPDKAWQGTTHVCRDWQAITSWQARHFSPMV